MYQDNQDVLLKIRPEFPNGESGVLCQHGADIAAQALNDGIISAVNASEVIARYVDLRASEEEALTSFRAFGLENYPFDESLAIATGLMRSTTRDAGMAMPIYGCPKLALEIPGFSGVF